MLHKHWPLLAFGLFSLFPLVARADTPAVIWVEGESPVSVTPALVKPAVEDVGRPLYLSGGKWFHLDIEGAEAAKSVPAEGIVLTYTLSAPSAGDYAVWDRVGYERVRSSFDWCVDGGAWATVKPDADTVDVEELQTWNPVAWLPLGRQTLTSGSHTLQIRLRRAKDGKGNEAKIVYASDALCLTTAPFHPDGPNRPGDPAALSEADKAAGAHLFTLAALDGAAQTATPLKGDWQVAADDEAVTDDRLGPIKAVPAADALGWHALPIPGDRNVARPELTYVHRCWLRTRVGVPAGLAGRSFFLHVPSENMIATVFVNGRRCGWTKTPYAAWDCDITQAVKPGQTNELWVGIKDAFYGLSNDENAHHPQYTPYEFWHYNLTNQLDMPVLSHYETGLLLTPSLVVAGRAYTSDVFAIPSVTNKALGLEVTVHNPTGQAMTVTVANRIVPMAGGQAAKTFASKEVSIPAGQDSVVKLSEGWTDPKLWWPDSPVQYSVVTTLSVGGQPIDERTTKFGFREWGWSGPQFTLNGVPWHGRADLAGYGRADAEAVALWHKHGQTMQRVWAEGVYGGKEMPDALDFFDTQGIPVRRTGIFDGEGANGFYSVTQNVGGKEVPHKALFDNWRQQLAAWVKGQRNHPSIFIWSMENEITFINAHVFGQDKVATVEMKQAADMLAALDPTRPQMTDGGNALLDESLPVYGGHYLQPSLDTLPEGAYNRAGFAHRQVWPITQVKPVLLGEDFFANGVDPSDLATVGGESAFAGKAESHPAIGLAARMLSEGYRWNGVNFHFWFGGESDLHYPAWQPVVVLCRQWDWTFGSGQKVTRTLGIFNDTHDASPITLTCTLTVAGRQVSRTSKAYAVAAGSDQKFNVVIPVPTVPTRQEGTWTLTLMRGGRQAYQEVKSVSVLPMGSARLSLFHVYHRRGGRVQDMAPTGQEMPVAVYDPAGGIISFLSSLTSVPFTRLTSLSALPASAKVLIIGRDALTAAQSTSSALAAYASGGHTVIVLEQKNPLHFQALPGDMAPDTNQGGIAFAEDLDHPVLHGLAQKDFFTWGVDGTVYRNAYVKPTTGGKSLIQCGERLQDTALAEMSAGRGEMLISQLALEQKLATNPVAQTLLLNMIFYGLSYRQVFHPVTAAVGDDAPLLKAMDAVGLSYAKASDPLAALGKPGGIAVVRATPAALHNLAQNKAKVDAWTRGGGWLVLNDVTPAGLGDYNALVGVNHLIRPFGQEKVTWPAVRNPLTAGLATSAVVMGSGKQIFGFSAGQYPDTDAFSYVLDYDDVAPFGKSPFFAWDKITNNYTQADGFWPLIINFPGPDPGKTTDIPITLPRSEKITQFTYVQDLNYNPTTKIALVFNGSDRVPLDVQPNGNPQTFGINPPRTARDITLQIVDYARKPGGGTNVGLDNIYLKAARTASFYQKVRPLLNIGAMLQYPRGAGGILLCNVKFKDAETNPENAGKKQTILATLLRNLHAPFSGGKTVIAGANNLTYTPLDLSKQADQYLTDQGWFGDKAFTFADLPRGHQRFAGVAYNIYNFTTSPVPTVIMLGGSGIPGSLPDHVSGIPVGRRADALFFLQAAHLDSRRSADEIKQGKRYEMADYVVRYADGTAVKVPVYAEISVEDYKQTAPAALPGAQIAWTRPYAGTSYLAVAYSQQWNNPFPDKVIQVIDLVYGPDRRGVPALLALTAASAR